MRIEILKSKIHNVKVTEANIAYIGSITIDENLMNAANLIDGEKVSVLSITNGERLETYVLKGAKGLGQIEMNGPAAKKIKKNHNVIIISYASIEFNEAKNFKPAIIFPNKKNALD